jgi:hypothetical protein
MAKHLLRFCTGFPVARLALRFCEERLSVGVQCGDCLLWIKEPANLMPSDLAVPWGYLVPSNAQIEPVWPTRSQVAKIGQLSPTGGE